MPEHRIRLNRAWEIRAAPLDFQTAHDDAAALMNAVVDERLDLPLIVDEEPSDDEGRPVRLMLTRWFNAPSNLAPGQPLQLIVEPAALASMLCLNDELLSPVHATDGQERLRFDLTDKLQRHNRLDILVGVPLALSQASIVLAISDDGSTADFDRFAADREPPP